MKKRIIALLLALVLTLGLLPAAALAADGGKVDVYIIGRDELISHQQVDLTEAAKIDVSEYTSKTAEGCTALHAIAAALQAEHLLEDFSCSGGYITQIGELVAGKPNYMSGWMYKLNDVLPDVSTAESTLKDGDELILFWEEGLEGQYYAQFNKRKASVKTGEKLSLSIQTVLLDVEDGLGKELTYGTLKGTNHRMKVYVDGVLYPQRLMTTIDTIDVYFATPGTHVVTAKVYKTSKSPNEHIVTMPVCEVTVTGDALPSAGGLKSLTFTGTSFTQSVELKNGVSEYELTVPYDVDTLRFTAELDETAMANKAYMQLLYVNAPTGSLMIPISKNKTGSTTMSGSMVKALNTGENDVALYVQCDPATHAYTTLYFRVTRSEKSPNATLSLDVAPGPNELASSAPDDLKNGELKLYYQKADGSTAFCTGTGLDLTAREYTIYFPYETEQVQLSPTVTGKGTCVVLDEDGNELDTPLIDFTGEEMTVTIYTTSSDETGHETYTLHFVRRPNAALTGASIDCGYLWVPGVIPGYNALKLYITDEDAQEYTASFEVTPGTKLYLGSIAEENRITDGKITRPTPKTQKSNVHYLTLYLVAELEDGSDYVRQVIVEVRENENGLKMVEYVTAPSQHMDNSPSDSNNGGMLSSFGGYVTLYAEEPIQNDPSNPYGIDFVVNGNPNYPNVWSFSEPAQVYVAQDKDGDGEPDKWYALAGSEHYEDTTYWDYEITYTDEGNYKVRWEDNYGGSGYVCGLSSGSSFPSAKVLEVNSRYRTQYEQGVLTLGGVLIGPIKAENYVHAPITIFGYGDCYPSRSATTANPYRDPGLDSIDASLTGEAWEKAMTDLYGQSSRGDGMDISWAVDEDGKPVYLDEISFIKLMSAINVDAGAFSEKSPEIFGVKRVESDAEDVGVSELPERITVNGRTVDLSGIRTENGQATATVYLQPGETAAEITVEAAGRNVILGNRYRTSYTYETIPEGGRLVRVITQDGEKAPSILVLSVRMDGPEKAVIEQIEALGTITKDSGEAIEAAEAAYEALSDEQKKLVDNHDVLLAARETYDELRRQWASIPSKPAKNEAAEQPSVEFGDVSSRDWFAESVQYVCANGLMNGTGNGNFSPNAYTTRGMIVTILARLNGVDTSRGKVWYEAGRAWAMANDVSDGTDMDGKITREQLALMLYRYAKLMGCDVSASAELNTFPDASSVSDWAKEAMRWAVGVGLIQGSGARLEPQAAATRAQVAAILMRFAEYVK